MPFDFCIRWFRIVCTPSRGAHTTMPIHRLWPLAFNLGEHPPFGWTGRYRKSFILH